MFHYLLSNEACNNIIMWLTMTQAITRIVNLYKGNFGRPKFEHNTYVSISNEYLEHNYSYINKTLVNFKILLFVREWKGNDKC